MVEAHLTGDRALPDPYRHTFLLTVYTHIRASAGPGIFGWEPADESDALRVERSKQLFAEMVGFWPPDAMEGIRVEGHSMRRPDGGIADGQIILYLPVTSIDSGDRYVLAVQDDEGDLDTRIVVKRVQAFFGGGIKIISDNPAAGVDDEVLIPDPDRGLVNERTGRVVTIGVLGRVIWPTNHVAETVALAVSHAIERLVGNGMIHSAAVQP